MTIASKELLPGSPSLLTVLRDVGREPARSIEDMRCIAGVQAHLLHSELPGSSHQFSENLHALFPSVLVEHVADVPVAGLSYWASGRWHIQVRASDSLKARAFTMLHQLKCIIDHPLRQQTSKFTEKEWNGLADYFAEEVLKELDQQHTPA